MATWTTTEAAEHLKISAARFRSIAAVAGVVPCGRQPGRTGENLWDIEAVNAIPRPGQGARTDLTRDGRGHQA